MWAAVPVVAPDGRRQAELVKQLRRDPARRRPRDLLPARRGRPLRRRRWLLALAVCARGGARAGATVAALPALRARVALLRARIAAAPEDEIAAYDPGRERRAEARARELLRSCVNDEDWEMYRDLGFLRVWGAGRHPGGRDEDAERPRRPTPT